MCSCVYALVRYDNRVHKVLLCTRVPGSHIAASQIIKFIKLKLKKNKKNIFYPYYFVLTVLVCAYVQVPGKVPRVLLFTIVLSLSLSSYYTYCIFYHFITLSHTFFLLPDPQVLLCTQNLRYSKYRQLSNFKLSNLRYSIKNRAYLINFLDLKS